MRGRRRRAAGPAILAGAAASQDTVTQLISATRRVAREVPGAAEQIAQLCSGHDYGKPGKPKIGWDDPQAKNALVPALVRDASVVIEAFRNAPLDEPACSALALLALVAGQDVEPAEGPDGTDGRWRIARWVAEDRVISTAGPGARHTRKSPGARRDGYRAHLAADPQTGIITDEKLTRAAGPENSDAAVAEEFVASEAARGEQGDPARWYGDSAYGSGELREAIRSARHDAVIRPMPVQRPVEGGFTIDDFAVSPDGTAVTCPAGLTRPVAASGPVTFGTACASCPLRQRCTTSATGRSLKLTRHDALLRAARTAWAAGTGLREDYMKHRPDVERAIAQAATWRGRRIKLRYAAPPRTTPGSSAAPPPSTCAT